ncbi:sporulation protein YabP [Clostridium acidisoli DSM 12555]|jgi:sporulation protein YabP|uniref:Sporulation protein YabP n=1 Tax=Clostridium acidisoli DSM 12555 TaxID=1121291 RepID=A0A1W1XWT1_9CLOT|nr:sporulation protein YabP [Clostridium acidisoli]SMC28327.1 sporulation protein YabP [Clostridium acidisoli DSM 12555]
MESKIEDKNNNIILENRKKLSITGVNEVISFNDEIIILTTSLGTLTLKGKDLKMNKLDVQNGDVMITGKINSFVYSEKENFKNKDSILNRLFR